jgi:tRNA(Ile)-lysidine synthase
VDKFSSYFLKKLIKTVKDSGLLTWGDRVMAAVSGGVDSSVLLYSLYGLRHYFGINIACASFDHKIRAGSGEDILFTADVCKKLSVPFYTESRDVKAYAKDNGLNLEEAARILRYGFLMKAAGDFKAEKIAAAHHLDDFAENFVMRLISGGGAGAIAGIPVRAGIIIRPLINHTKSEILDFARKNSVAFREDWTNNDTQILRNFVRLDIVPKLKERNPSFLKTVRNTSEILKKDDDFIAGIALKLFKDIAKYDADERKAVFGKDDLSKIEEALLYRLLKISVSVASEGGNGNVNEFLSKKTIIYYKHFKAFIKLLKSKKPNAYFNIDSFIAVRREYDNIVIEYIPLRKKLTFKSFSFELKNGAGYFNFPGYNYKAGAAGAVKIEEINKTFYIKKLDANTAEKIRKDILGKKFIFEPDTAYFDYDKIVFPVTVRNFNEGDRFVPLGMSGVKKLKEYFIDKKVPANIRKIVPVAMFGDKIAWVSFNEVSDNIKVTEFTENVGIMKVE